MQQQRFALGTQLKRKSFERRDPRAVFAHLRAPCRKQARKGLRIAPVSSTASEYKPGSADAAVCQARGGPRGALMNFSLLQL